MSKSQILFGSDPEMFAIAKEGGHVVPPVVFRTKWGVDVTENGNHPIFSSDDGVIIHEDGAAFEMSLSPSTNWKDLFSNINNAKEKFSTSFLSLFQDVENELKAIPTAKWDPDVWDLEGPEFHLSTMFGCDPDEDAFIGTGWKKARRSAQFNAKTHPYRYGGGHIHISGVKEIKESPLIAIRSLAITAGLAQIAFSRVPDLEKLRAFRYGLPGKFRVQNYGKLFNDIPDTDSGIEYRTLSNSWTADFTQAEKIFEWINIGINNLLVEGLFKELPNEILIEGANAIAEADSDKAINILSVLEQKL